MKKIKAVNVKQVNTPNVDKVVKKATKKISKNATKAVKKTSNNIKNINKTITNKVKHDKVENAKKRARAFILNLQSQGFAVPENIKDVIDAKTPERMTDKQYERFMYLLNSNVIKSRAKLGVSVLKKESNNIQLNRLIETNIKMSDWNSSESKAVAKAINSSINESKTLVKSSYDYSLRIDTLATKLTGVDDLSENYDKAKGYEDEYIKIDKGWDGKAQTLSNFITFKKIKMTEEIKEIIKSEVLGHVYSSEKAYDVYKESYQQKAQDEAFDKIIEDLKRDYNIDDITTDELENLKHLMDNSDAWWIAKSANYDSDQDAYIELMEKMEKASRNITSKNRDDWEELKQYIENLSKPTITGHHKVSKNGRTFNKVDYNESLWKEVNDKINNIIKNA